MPTQFEKRKDKKIIPIERSKINVNKGRVRVTIDFEPREPEVEHEHKGSNGDDFLTEGLE
jgi:hypothetical protein